MTARRPDAPALHRRPEGPPPAGGEGRSDDRRCLLVIAAMMLGIVGVGVKDLLIIGFTSSPVPPSWRAGDAAARQAAGPVSPAAIRPRLPVLLCE